MPSFLTKWFSSVPSRLWQQFVPAGLVLLIPAVALCQARPLATVPAAGGSTRLISAVPMAFEENDGQLAPGLAYMGRAQSYSVGIERDGLSFFMPDSTIGVRFAGSRGGSPVSLSGVAYRSNYFIGADPSRWHKGVANYSRVGVRGIYPGIDTEFYEKNGELEHDFVLAPGADAKEIRLDLRSAHHAALTANGDAVIPVANGELCFRKPVAYQFDAKGRRIAVDASYKLSGHNLRFDLGSYDRSRTLVIDPVIVFATYVAGTAGSTPAQMATDGTGATLFLTGTTTSITGFPASATSTNHSGSGTSNVFVAALTTTQLGSALKWITFLGNTSISTATSIAYTAGSQATLYVGGTTGASGFPGTPTGTIHATDPGSFGGSFPAGGGVSGFVTNLAPADGTGPVSTYVSTLGASAPNGSGSDSTTVSGVAEDSSGNVYIAGYGPGTKLPLTANALGGTSILPNPATGAENAFVIELNAKLNTASLVTYLQSTSAVAANYEATAVQVDGSGNIYVAGTAGGTSVAFPTAQSFSATNGHYDDTKDFSHCTRGGANTSAFLAQINPATHDTLSFSMFTCADTTSGSETAHGLALGANGIYLAGDTLSPDLPTGGISYSNTSTPKTAVSPTTGLQAAFATGNTNGYVIHVPISSGVGGAPDAFTFLGGTSAGGNTTIYAAALDSTNNLIQLAGQTAATRATMPGVGAPGLPESGGSTQDQSGDNKRAFLYTFEDATSPAPLSAAALKSISYLGNATTGSQAVSVQPDSAGAGAFVLVQDAVGASGFSYTSADAAGTAAPSKTNAYLADVQGTNVAASTPGVTLASATSAVVDPGGSSPVSCGAAGQPACTIAYDPTDPTNISTIEYTWTLSTSAEASNVVLNFPPFPELASPYTLDLGGVPNSTCASSTASNGLTCSIATLAAASSFTVKLTGKASAGDSPTATPTSLVGQAFQMAGTAADAEGEYQVNAPAQPTVTVANPIKLTLTFVQSTGTVDAANGAADTGSANHTTEVTYTATLKNTSAYDSPNTVLTVTLPLTSAFTIVPGTYSATVNGTTVTTGCNSNGSGCTAVDIPKNGTLVYTFTAQYLAASLTNPPSATTPATTAGPVPEQLTAAAHAASTSPGSTPTPVTLTTNVNGYAAVTVSVTQPCYPGGPIVNCNPVTPAVYTNSATAFNLGATGLTYTVTINNAGPNAVNTGSSLNFTNTLPTGFSVTSATAAVTGSAAATCSAAGTSCSITALPSTGKIVYTIVGSFPDNATGTGTAVPANAASATVTDTAALPTLPAGTFNPNSLTNAQNVTVQRLIHLKLTLTLTSTPTATGASYPTQPGFNLSTTVPVTYTYTIQNAGPDYAINVGLTSLDAPPVGYTPPSGSLAVTPPAVAGLSCSGAPAANLYTACNIKSIAPATSPTFAYTVLYPDLAPNPINYANQIPVSAVPGNASNAIWSYSISTPATYPNAVDNTPTPGDNASNTTVTIYRTTHLKISIATPTATATGASYPSQPGYNLSSTALNYTYSIENDGPNIAVYVPLSNAFAQLTPPAGFTPPSGSVNVTAPTGPNFACTNGATTLYSSNCTIGSVSPNTSATPLQLVFPVTYPDLGYTGAYPAPESVSAVPTDHSSATYNDTATTPATYANSVDSNAAATAGGSNTFTAPASIYRTVHLKFTLVNSGTTVSGPGYALPAPNNANNGYNLGSPVQYTYQIQNSGPNIALNVPFSSTLAATNPAVYAAPAGSFLVTTPSGSVQCSLAGNNTTSTCNAAALAPGTDNLNFSIAYPDLPPTSYVFPTQDLSAVPSSVNNATYKYSTLGPATYTNAIDSNPTATAGGDNAANSSINLFRTSALTLATPAVTGDGTPCAPSSPTPCFYMANSGGPTNTGLQDTATYTVQVNNNGPNLATNSVLTIPLPANFLVTPNTSVAFNGISQTGVPSQLNCTNPATPNASCQLVCSYQSGPNAMVCQGYVPSGSPHVSTVTVTSKFSTTTVPVGASFTTTTASPGSASVAATAVGTYTPVNLPVVAIDRASHLVAAKLVAPAPGNVSPNGFMVNGVLAVNLDEKVAGDANGKNDTVQITQQVGNAGLNDATGVVITDTLPPYFILTQLPSPSVATCTMSGPTTADAAGHPMTGAAPVTLTCNLVNAVPRGTATAGSGTSHGTVTGAFAQVVYYGKFEDNGLQPDAIPLTANSASIQFGTLSAASVDVVNLGAASDSTSAPVAPVPVMRAAHLHFTVTQYVQPGDAALNPVGGVTGPGIAEAQLGANGGEVINPLRYQVQVTNDGPNIATDPIVSTTLPLNPGGGATKFVNVAQGVEPSSVSGFPTVPSGCASGMACQDAGMIATGGAVLYNVDGNFDINTLTEGNSGARTFASVVASASVIDSNPAATAAGAQQTNLPITVVNTPSGANYTLAPLAGNLSQPVQLKLTTVQVAGITGLAVGGSTAPAVPMGASPNPPDNGKTVPLYRFGQGGVYYALGTTAGIPTATTNQTQVCLNSIPDVFQKPERVLLWALSNAPAGTAFGTVPHFTSTATEGDITTMVVPQGGGGYSVPTSSQIYPPTAQPQPAMVCGVVNGLASAANPTMLAVLEPVNFAPYIRTQVTAANSTNSQPGKGVTASAAQVDLTISPQNNYDYNDADPCYTGTGGTTRSACNDNVQLTTFLFGGGNLIGDAAQQHSYSYQDLQQTPKPQFNLPAGSPQLYLVLVDQLGAQGYKNVNTSNPSAPLGCDPGNPSTAYTPSTPACPLSPPLQGTAPAVPPLQAQFPLNGGNSAEVALLIGNVGFGGSAGLIPLPQTPTPEATANVTAGQTAGFVWNWLTEQPAVQAMGSTAPPVLTLTCASADGTDLASKGITCNVQPTYTYSTGSGNTYAITAPPAIYVVTTANTAVGALHQGPLDRELHIIAAVVFPIGAIPLVILLRRRRALKLSGWLAVLFFASLIGVGIGCGSNSSFKNQGGTTSTATPAGTYQFVVTATGTDSSGNAIDIKTYPFAVTVSAVK